MELLYKTAIIVVLGILNTLLQGKKKREIEEGGWEEGEGRKRGKDRRSEKIMLAAPGAWT